MSYRAGFVALIGQPNAGKSTLMNCLVKEKISIVTEKPQTTRRRVLGIVNSDQGQVVFVDSPGVIAAKKGLNSFLAKEVQDICDSSDVLIAVLNVDEKEPENLVKIIELAKQSKRPWIAVINKVDKTELFRRIQKIKEMVNKAKAGTPVIEFSSQWQSDVETASQQIFDSVLRLLPESPQPLYDVELFTPHSSRDIIAELIREACFEQYKQEIPYSLAIRIEKYEETKPNFSKIYAEILVARESHKPIVIGKGGLHLKKVGSKARREIEKLLGHKIFLGLQVSVRPDWFDNKRIMKELGYVVDERN